MQAPGFYGKMPSKGDFVQRRLARGVVDPFDAWLQQAIAHSKAALGDGWTDIYLTSPIWRFAWTDGVCGEPAGGVLMPSIDRVGRHYPLFILGRLPPGTAPFHAAADPGGWYRELEAAALGCLDADADMDAFDARLIDVGAIGPTVDGAEPQVLPGAADARRGWRMGDGASDRLASGLFPALLDAAMRIDFSRYSLWWTVGSDLVAPTFLIYPGLPPVADFQAFMTGEWGGP